MHPIAHIESPFKEKFGVPRQAGLVDYECRVVFEPDYRVAEALRGIDEFDYLWLLWQFHLNKHRGNETVELEASKSRSLEVLKSGSLEDSKSRSLEVLKSRSLEDSKSDSWSPTVRPPRLGGNKRVGVFATRSPFRPNPIGLSSVRLLRVEETSDQGHVLVVSGADLVDGTPILDIKPYLPYADCHPDARGGFAAVAPPAALAVVDPDNLLATLPALLREPLVNTLSQDPRPHYQHDPQRLYSMTFDRYEVRFRVTEEKATIVTIEIRDTISDKS